MKTETNDDTGASCAAPCSAFVATTEDDGIIWIYAEDTTPEDAVTRWIDECAYDDWEGEYHDGLEGEMLVVVSEQIFCRDIDETHPMWEESHDPETGERYLWVTGKTIGEATVIWTLDDEDSNPLFKLREFRKFRQNA